MTGKFLPCPFCGNEVDIPKDEDVYGTMYEFDCDCGCAGACVQISDLMEQEERSTSTFIDYQYELKYIARAREYCMEMWNTRAKP